MARRNQTPPAGDRPEVLQADLAIVGGGLAGLPLAIACAGAGVATVVIDREPPEAMLDEPFDGRTTAIAYGSQRILAAIGVWPHLAAEAEPILAIRVADGRSPLFLHYDHRAVGEAPLGWIVENRAFRRALFAAMAGLPALTHLAPAAVAAVERGPRGAEIALADGRRLRARLVAAADGKNSGLRQQAGIGVLGWSYPQHAIICTVQHEMPHGGVAVEHFLPSGPFAILPMTGSRSSIVWTEQAASVQHFMALAPAAFEAAVADRFGPWLGAVAVVGPRASYPLQLMLAQNMAAERLVLVGDAAHVIHPIAGQGLNLGIRDVAVLAELVVEACRLGLDPGAPALTERYARARRADTLALAAATDGLNRLFSNRAAPLALLRDIGLALVEHAPPLKRLFMRHAMGLAGSPPRLTRGVAL